MVKKTVAQEIEDLYGSLDEMYMMLAEQADMIESLHEKMRERDKMNLLMVKHVERLVQEKDFLLKHIGMLDLMKSVKK